MNQRQQNSLKMFKAVAALFGQLPNSWSSIAPVSQTFSSFLLVIGKIESADLGGQNDTEGNMKDDNVGMHYRATAANLELLFSEASLTLDTLDDIVESLLTDKDFILTYKQVRKSTDRKGQIATDSKVA